MSEVTLSPIPYDGGSLMPMNGAGICRLSAGKYFTVHAQKNPNYIFGGIWSVSGEGSSSPSATSVRTQVLTEMSAPWNNMSSSDIGFYVNCEKITENVVLVERRMEINNAGMCDFFAVKIDESTNQMTMVGDTQTYYTARDEHYSPPQDGQLNRTCLKNIGDGEVLAVGFLHSSPISYPTTINTAGVRFVYNSINESLSSSVRFTDSTCVIRPNEAHLGNQAVFNIKECSEQDGHYFVTCLVGDRYGNHGSQYDDDYRIGVSGRSAIYSGSGSSWSRVQVNHNGNQTLGNSNSKAPFMTLPRTSSDYYNFGLDGIMAKNSDSSWSSYAPVKGAWNNHPYYAGFHSLGNDDPSTFVTVFSQPALGTVAQIHTNSSFSLRVGKIPNFGSTAVSSAATAYRDKSFTGAHCIKGESSFEKFSEATIMQYGYQGNNFKLVYINLD